jgi:hypothetical protein
MLDNAGWTAIQLVRRFETEQNYHSKLEETIAVGN